MALSIPLLSFLSFIIFLAFIVTVFLFVVFVSVLKFFVKISFPLVVLIIYLVGVALFLSMLFIQGNLIIQLLTLSALCVIMNLIVLRKKSLLRFLMTDNLYLMYNRLSSRFSSAFSSASDAVAKRSVHNTLSQGNIDFNDFDLYRIGSFDVERGCVEILEPPVRVDFRELDTISSVESRMASGDAL